MVNDNIAALCMVHVAETDEEAYASAAREGEWFVGKAEELYAPWAGRNVPQSYQFAVNAVQEERVDKTADDHLASGAFAMGTPETVIKTIEKYQEAGVDQTPLLHADGQPAPQQDNEQHPPFRKVRHPPLLVGQRSCPAIFITWVAGQSRPICEPS